MRLWPTPMRMQSRFLIRSLDTEDHIGCISRFMIGKQLDLYLNDDTGRRLKNLLL